MKTKSFLAHSCLLFFFSTSCSVFGIRGEEQPEYKVLVQKESFEIRQYQKHIVAKTTIDGDFKQAQNKGFRILADYIFGKNKSRQKIAMTAPVVQKEKSSNEKIAMTAPVTIAPKGKDANGPWTMTFSMPSKYTMETLPVPEDDRVQLEEVSEKFVAAHRFTGFWGESKNKRKADELRDWLRKEANYTPVSEPMFAGYDPPWTIPFFRRNEMLIEVMPTDK